MRTMAIYLLMLLILSWSAPLFAQKGLPEPQMASTPGPPPPGLVVPIDMGLNFLLISGVLLGCFYVIKFPRKLH